MGRSDAFGVNFYCQKRKLMREPIFPNTTKNRVQMTNIFKQQKNSMANSLSDSPGKQSTTKKSAREGDESPNVD